MRRAIFAVGTLVLSLQAGCSCLVNPGAEEEGQPCLNGLCLAGYRCDLETDLCVSTNPKRDGGLVGPRDGGWPKGDAGTGRDAGPVVPGWQSAESIGHPWSGSPRQDLAPRLAMSDNGDLFLAFADTYGAVNLRRRSASAGVWDPIHVPCAEGCSSPLVAAGPGGTAVAAWSAGDTMYASLFIPDLGWPAGWQGPVYAASGMGVPISLVAIDARSNGAAVLYRVGYPGGAFDLSLTVSANGTWHQTGVAVGLPANSPAAMAIAFDDPNLLLMTVHGLDRQVWASPVTFNTRAPNLVAGPVEVLWSSPMAEAQARSVALASDGHGSTLAVFDTEGPDPGLHAARFSNPSWGATSRFPAVGDSPAASVDPFGNGLALFRQCAINCKVWGAGYADHGAFSQPVAISPGSPVVERPLVAHDGAGRALQTWLQEGSVWASETLQLTAPPPFGAPRQISPAGAAFSPASLALVYSNGLGYAAWIHIEGSSHTLEGALYRAPVR